MPSSWHWAAEALEQFFARDDNESKRRQNMFYYAILNTANSTDWLSDNKNDSWGYMYIDRKYITDPPGLVKQMPQAMKPNRKDHLIWMIT